MGPLLLNMRPPSFSLVTTFLSEAPPFNYLYGTSFVFYHKAYIANYEAPHKLFHMRPPLILAVVTTSRLESRPLNYLFYDSPLVLTVRHMLLIIRPKSIILISYEPLDFSTCH